MRKLPTAPASHCKTWGEIARRCKTATRHGQQASANGKAHRLAVQAHGVSHLAGFPASAGRGHQSAGLRVGRVVLEGGCMYVNE
ncbi:hypothetical protein [Limnohabitans sp.]|uniref:hypothetical protein n=1 Tax=Limnohabitans sp. TaxID=1907725 RepID=UPI00311D8DD4